MTAAFLVFFVLYLLYALWENLVRNAPEGKRLSVASALLQAPLFITAAWLAVEHGAINRNLVFLPDLVAAVALGHGLFTVSLLVTDRQPREALRHFLHVRPVLSYLANDPMTLFRVFGVSLAEEVIYRVAAQPLLISLSGNAAVGILLAAGAFCVVHAHFFRNPLGQSLEFAAFSLLLGGVYFSTGSLAAVALIHATRNWEIAYLEHAIGMQEAPEHGAESVVNGSP